MILSASDIASVLGAVGGGAFLTAVFQYFKDRKQIKVNDEVAEDTRGARVGEIHAASLQKQLTYLENIIGTQDKHNARLQNDLEEALERERILRNRVFELENEVSQLKRSAVDMQARCEQLEMKMAEIRKGPGGKPLSEGVGGE